MVPISCSYFENSSNPVAQGLQQSGALSRPSDADKIMWVIFFAFHCYVRKVNRVSILTRAPKEDCLRNETAQGQAES